MKIIVIYNILIVTMLFGLSIPSNHIVSTKWLQKNLSNKNLVIIDSRKQSTYKKGHIPNAINIPFEKWFEGKIGNISHMYDTPEQVKYLFDKAGITKHSIVIFYSAGIKKRDYCDSASGVWNGWLYGFKNSAILDGGFTKWEHQNKTITRIIRKPKISNYQITTFDNHILASNNDVINAIYTSKIELVDARNTTYFIGKDKDKLLVRHGRIPTAILSSSALQVKKIDDYFVFIPKKESKKILTNGGYGINLHDNIIVYCNTGHNARGLWFVMKFLDNVKHVKNYDGSMTEYSKTFLPIARGEPMSF